MATTRDYLGYLNETIEIAPANSQEELLAAESIQKLMEEHGLETNIQEFDAPAGGSFPQRIVMLVLFLGVFLSGLQGTPVAIVGIVLVALCAIIRLLNFLGKDILAGIGPRARSQNVVGLHRAEGPLAARGNRPIVVVAHYDTARESFLYASFLARIQGTLKRLVPIFVLLSCLFGLVQVLSFIPGGVRRIVWALGIISSLPLLLLGIEGIYTRFSNCSEGANDNKTGVAALLGVMGMVRPGADSADGYADALERAMAGMPREADTADTADADARFVEAPTPVEEPQAPEPMEQEAEGDYAGRDAYDDGQEADVQEAPVEEPEPSYVQAPASDEAADREEIPAFLRPPAAPEEQQAEVAPATEDLQDRVPQVVTERYEKIKGVRHGRDVLTDLRMLPSSCEIVYVEPQLVSRSVRPQDGMRSQDGLDASANGGFVASAGSSYEAADAYDAYDEDVYEEEQGGRLASIADAGRGFLGRLKERFAQVRERIGHRGAADEEVPEVERTGVREPLRELDDAEVLDFGGDDEPVEPRVSLRERLASRLAPREETVSAYEPETERAAEPEDSWRDEQSSARVAEEAEATDGDSAAMGDTAAYAPVAPRATVPEASPQAADREAGLMPGISFEEEPDPTDEEIAMRDASGLDAEVTIEPDADAPRTVEERPRPANVEDPSWGRSEYRPESGGGFARRAALYDLPDPTTSGSDPFARQGQDAAQSGLEVRSRRAAAAPQEAPSERRTRAAAPRSQQSQHMRQTGSSRGRQRAQDGQSMSEWLGVEEGYDARSNGAAIGSWDRFDEGERGERGGRWKGGAATRAGLRGAGYDRGAGRGTRGSLLRDDYDPSYEEGYPEEEPMGAGVAAEGRAAEGYYRYNGGYVPEQDDQAYGPESIGVIGPNAAGEAQDLRDADAEPRPEELREAILGMGNEELAAHDIWFVALGGSELDHAGIKNFLAEYRARLRGAYLINLDSVGAGALTTYTREGQYASRRTDRRLERLLTSVAEDLHIDLEKTTLDHGDTDATPAMRASVRAVTITGLSDAGVPALSHTSQDVIENVDPAQATAAADLVAELIRRS